MEFSRYIRVFLIFTILFSLFPCEKVHSIPPFFTSCPQTPIVVQWNEQIYLDIDAEDPEMDSVTFILLSGPGEVDSLTGIWYWDPTCQDVGSHEVEICVRDSSTGCPSGNECNFTVTINDAAPTIEGPCGETVFIGPGYSDSVQFCATDTNGPSDTVIWSISDIIPVWPFGYYNINQNGLFEFYPGAPDYGYDFYFIVRATDCAGFYTECQINIDYLSNACADLNNDHLINIFDVVYMISFLYIDGPSPNPMELADVNNDGAVNIFDVTYLISYLYLNGPPLDCP